MEAITSHAEPRAEAELENQGMPGAGCLARRGTG